MPDREPVWPFFVRLFTSTLGGLVGLAAAQALTLWVLWTSNRLLAPPSNPYRPIEDGKGGIGPLFFFDFCLFTPLLVVVGTRWGWTLTGMAIKRLTKRRDLPARPSIRSDI